MKQSLLLYDGQCLLCDRWIRSLALRDKNNQLTLASLQDFRELKTSGKPNVSDKIDSMVLISKSKIYYKSNAALHAMLLVSSWGWLYRMLLLIPSFVRNAVYNVIARYRYNVLGKSHSCLLPKDNVRAKYIVGVRALEDFFRD